jgi:tRNA modification GTPase
LELYLDYPDEDSGDFEFPYDLIDSCITGTEELASTFQLGKLYQQGVKVVIAGKTNVGKSSLFNLLLKEDRSIVTDIHGTTRDYIESWITMKGIPVLLYDTAGLRVSAETVESEGIRRSERVLADADLVIYMVDAEIGLTAEEKAELLRRQDEENYLLVWNKTDLSADTVPGGFIPLSVKTGRGFSDLEEALYRRIAGEKQDIKADVVIDSVRQRDLLLRASRSLRKVREEAEEGIPIDLLSLELREASDALGRISGEISSAEVLDNLFRNFCLGK